MDAKKVWNVFQDYLVITLGLFLYALAWAVFILPNHMVSGGVSGISAILQYTTGIHMSYYYFGITVILFLIGYKLLGRSFGIKTVYGIVVSSLFLNVVPQFVPEDFINEFSLQNGKLICSLLGGGIVGLGIGLCFNRGGSTGGTDIIALAVNKFRQVPPGKTIFILDIFIVGSSLFIPQDGGWGLRIANVAYGYMIVLVCGKLIALTISGDKQSVQFMIFTKTYEKMAEFISNDLHRGVTILDGQGWYSKTPSHVVMTIVRKNESAMLLQYIKQIDPHAFVSMASVTGVYGKGFETIKSKKKLL